MHVEAESPRQHLLRLRSIHRFARSGAEHPEAFHVIRGQLRGKQGAGVARDDGKERPREDDQERGDAYWDEKTEPGRARSIRGGRQGATSRFKARRQRFGAKAVGTCSKEAPRATFLARNRSTRGARVEVPLHLGTLSLWQRSVSILGQLVANSTAVRFHRRPPATSARTGATGVDRRSNNSRRPREMRDITVPIGTLNISAISA